jgi:uncharacterized lipoprotein YmbA
VHPRSPALPALLSLLLAGCLPKPHADPTRYYLLSAVPSQEPSPHAFTSDQPPLLGLGPVELPRYLDRSELVSRPSANQLSVADNDRWGEPLLEGFRRSLRQDLAALLGTDGIVMHPFKPTNPPQLVLTVDVSRFEPAGAAERRVELVARWTLRTGEGRVLAAEEAAVREPISGDGGRGAEVAALSRALGQLAGLMAPAVRAGSVGARAAR